MTHAEAQAQYDEFKKQGLILDMSRGKPSPEQLDLSNALLGAMDGYKAHDGTDTRNYGGAVGLPEARSLFGKVVTITSIRGRVAELPDGGRALVTIHPSALLRMPDEASRRREFRRFVDDLAACADFLKQKRAA